jgi:hypothetical protein
MIPLRLQAATSALWPKRRIDMQTAIPMDAAVMKIPARKMRTTMRPPARKLNPNR